MLVPLVLLLLLLQFWMLDYAAEQDFFSSEFFFWVDATGSFRSAPTPTDCPQTFTLPKAAF